MNFIISGIYLIKEITRKKITIYGAQASFFLLLSIIPFIMAFLNMVQFISPLSLDEVYKLISNISGRYYYKDILLYIIDELYLRSNETLISLSLLGAIWSSSKGVYAIEQGLTEIYGNHRKQGYVTSRIISFLYTFLVLIALIASVIILVFGKNIQDLVFKYAPPLYQMISLILHFKFIVTLPVLIIVFMCMYTFYPGRKIHFTGQFLGAAFSATGWIIFSSVYEYYIRNITNYSKIYGSMGAVLLLLLWLYFCMCIFLIGAEINHFLAHR